MIILELEWYQLQIELLERMWQDSFQNWKIAIAFLLFNSSLLGFVMCFKTMLESFITDFNFSFNKVLNARLQDDFMKKYYWERTRECVLLQCYCAKKGMILCMKDNLLKVIIPW